MSFCNQQDILTMCETRAKAAETELRQKWVPRTSILRRMAFSWPAILYVIIIHHWWLIMAVKWPTFTVKQKNNSSVQVHKSFLGSRSALYSQESLCNLTLCSGGDPEEQLGSTGYKSLSDELYRHEFLSTESRFLSEALGFELL